MLKRSISFLMAFLLLAVSSVNLVLAENRSDDNYLDEEGYYEEYDSEITSQIDAFMDEREEKACLGEWDEVEELDRQLEELGVEHLTSEEVYERFGGDEAVVPYVNKPDMDNVKWTLSKTTSKYNGIIYEIQTLIAQPNHKNSGLRIYGGKVILANGDMAAGVAEAIKVVASAAVGFINKEAGIILTVYDTIKAVITKASKTMMISSAHIVYSYAFSETASFKYVKIKGRPDIEQQLTYISTKGTLAAGYQYTDLVCKNNFAMPNIIQGKIKTMTYIPRGYNDTKNAVIAYGNPYPRTEACIDVVNIIGVGRNRVIEIHPIRPQFPAHVF